MIRSSRPMGILLVLLVVAQVSYLEGTAAAQPTETTGAVLLPGLGSLHHPITTNSAEAQEFFDQGLTLFFGFHYGDAVRSFRHAAALDPQAAMPHWGVALALGPNLNNRNPSDEQRQHADEALESAFALNDSAAPVEQIYIRALAQRHPLSGADLGEAGSVYAEAMRTAVRQLPDDPTAAALGAEALRLLQGEGEPGTDETVGLLESALQRTSDHIGLHHYYIHLMEFSATPERALDSARFLESATPGLGHLLHMPAHIYSRIGDYRGAVTANLRASAADASYTRAGGSENYMMAHTLEYLAKVAQMAGRYDTAIDTAHEIARREGGPDWHVPQHNWAVTDTLLRFHRWEQLLAQEPPRNPTIYHLVWRFSQVVALAASGRLAEAEEAYSVYESEEADIPEDETWIGNPANRLFPLMRNVMQAWFDRARGDRDAAIPHWRSAVGAFDEFENWEYLSWYKPVRESLGAELFLLERFDEAEDVFREDLARLPGNPRSLFGLWRTLEAQGRLSEAEKVRRRFQTAWQDADVPLAMEDL